jgi:hypothetical protein
MQLYATYRRANRWECRASRFRSHAVDPWLLCQQHSNSALFRTHMHFRWVPVFRRESSTALMPKYSDEDLETHTHAKNRPTTFPSTHIYNVIRRASDHYLSFHRDLIIYYVHVSEELCFLLILAATASGLTLRISLDCAPPLHRWCVFVVRLHIIYNTKCVSDQWCKGLCNSVESNVVENMRANCDKAVR